MKLSREIVDYTKRKKVGLSLFAAQLICLVLVIGGVGTPYTSTFGILAPILIIPAIFLLGEKR